MGKPAGEMGRPATDQGRERVDEAIRTLALPAFKPLQSYVRGEVREWLNRAVSKIAVP